ncbi:MAG: trk/ktr system potassium uptake protein [Eubacteriales bacterium]|nr:trk/ktr system potassium uptake protein [Eubacteriales bacterium]
MYIVVAGGGKVGYYLTKMLLDEGHEVTVIETDPAICEAIAEELGIMVINGDASSLDILDDAGVGQADVLAAVTGKDQDNLVICQLAKRNFGVPKTVARVNNPKNQHVFYQLGVDVAISSTAIIAQVIETELITQHIKTLLTMKKGDASIVEVDLPADSPAAGKQVKELGLPADCVLVSIIRGDNVLIPHGRTVLEVGDAIVAIVSKKSRNKMVQILLGK